MIKEFIKKNIKYLFLFILFFFCIQFFYAVFSQDQIYNYGFSYAISRGEVPYRDFNMIIPPMGAFIYAIPLLIGGSYLEFNLFQSFLLCVLFFYLFKLYDEKAWFILFVLMIIVPLPLVSILFQGYNFLLILEFVILLYLEKNKKSDYLIGILLGVAILTKQTVGILLCLSTFVYLIKDYKKFIKRIIGLFIPCLIFFIYLILTKSFTAFFDLCFLGMFDFTKKNGGFRKYLSDFSFYLFMIEIIGLCFLMIKYRKDENTLRELVYIFLFSSIAVPLFDYLHVVYFTFVFLLFFVGKIKISEKYKWGINVYILSSVVGVVWFLFFYNFKMPNIENYNNFKWFICTEKNSKEFAMIISYMKKRPNTILLSENTYLIKIILDREINYFDLLNYGNHGYNGSNKLISMLNKEKDKYLLVNMEAYKRKNLRQQFNKEVIEYVLKNYQKVDKLGVYDIYYKE